MKREVWAIFLVVFVSMLGYTIILPILPFYAEQFGATPFMAGLLFTSYAICQFVAGPILGSLSDRQGRKPWLIFSQLGTAIGFIMIGFAQSLPMLFAARILDGLSGGNIVIAQAYISDITAPEERAKTFGLIGVAFGLGFIVGPTIGGILAHYSYALPAFVAAGISMASVATTYFILPETRREEHHVAANFRDSLTHFRIFLRSGELRLLLLEFFIFTTIFYTYTTSITLYLERILGATPRQVGFLFGYVGILILVGQGVLLRMLLKRFPERAIARLGFFLCLISFLILILLPRTWPWTIVATTFFSLGVSQLRPTLTSIISQKASRTEQGRTLGVTQSVDSMSAILGPTIGGAVITYLPILTFGMVEAVGALFGFLLLSRKIENSA